MPKICPMARLHDMHLWGEYANIHATYQVAPINDVTSQCTQTTQDDYDSDYAGQ